MDSPFKRLEIEINTHCDMKCFACDRFLDVSPSPDMTVQQIHHFVEESLALSWEWCRIHILGGEPTLHPSLREIVEELIRYRNHFPGVLLRIISNGHGNLQNHRGWLERKGITINIEGKTSGENPQWFRNMRRTPYDEDPNDCPKPACSIYGQGEGGCGIGLTRHGLFLCGAGASVARMLGLDIGVMHLKDLTHERMLEQAEKICHVCGHWNPINGPVRDNLITKTGPVMGEFWTEKLKGWKPLPMSIYGEEHAET